MCFLPPSTAGNILCITLNPAKRCIKYLQFYITGLETLLHKCFVRAENAEIVWIPYCSLPASQFHVACKATIVSLILNLKMNKYAKISCSAHVEASKSIFFTVKPLFLFLENINMTRNDRKKKNHYLKVIPLAFCVENLHADQSDLLLGPILLWFWEEKHLVQVARPDL